MLLVPQFGLIREATDALGVCKIEQEGYEADDMIAAYARAFEAEGGRVTIVSSDKDLMQLVRPGVEMLDPIKQKPIREAEVAEKFGVPPEKVADVQALAGAEPDAVLTAWAGLGYYARARNLHRCAKIISTEMKGEFPADPALLQKLPGIGPYTAAAIAAIAFDTASPVLVDDLQAAARKGGTCQTIPPLGKTSILTP